MSTNKKSSTPTASVQKITWLPICLILLVIIFFSIRLIITHDSAHYLNYVSIFEGNLPTSSWDIVRGPVFPIIIFVFNTIFGKTGAGILVGTFIFYILFIVACYFICKDICKYCKHRNLILNTLIIILTFNPLILGYFHVLLTEFVAITFAILNILLSFKWIYCKTNNKGRLFLYSIYFIFSIAFCYHLKQSYITISIFPPLIATIISIIHNHKIKNILYRTGTIIASIIFLILSLVIWDNILRAMQVDFNTGRDSSSMFSQQLLKAYQITYDQDGDGNNDPVSITNALGILSQDFISDPSHITSTYISNYCGLTSICAINTENNIEYTPSFDFAGINTFENTIIGYRPYTSHSNIFEMDDSLYRNASIYGENTDRSLIAYSMNLFKIPTNLLFKLATALCLPSLIFLFIIKIKFKNQKYSNLFILCLLLLLGSFLHLAFTAGIGLIIDRYAIEAFVPSSLGIFGAGTYTFLVINASRSKTKTKKLALSS